VVATQVRLARELAPKRSERWRPPRSASGKPAEFTAAIAEHAGVEVEVLSDEEEARLAFVGARAPWTIPLTAISR